MVVEPRAPSFHEMEKLIYFLNRSLRPNADWSIDKEYPFVFSKENRENMRIISAKDEILSHAAIKPLFVQTPMGLLKIAAIGSVVTHEDHRLQGLSQKVIKSCLDKALKEDYDFVVLWTEIYDFYRPMDFELAGYELSFIFEKEIQVPNESNLRFMQSNKISSELLLSLYSRHTVFTLRKASEIQKYLEIPKTCLYTAWDEDHKLKAYAIEGKGVDLSNYIHEWGGGVSSLMPLFSYIRRKKGMPITLITPFYSENLIRALSSYKNEIVKHTGFLGMIRLLNLDPFFQKVKKYALLIGIKDFSFHREEDSYVIQYSGKVFKIKSLKELTCFVFGTPSRILEPSGLEDLVNQKELFPLPIWLWGWDSV